MLFWLRLKFILLLSFFFSLGLIPFLTSMISFPERTEESESPLIENPPASENKPNETETESMQEVEIALNKPNETETESTQEVEIALNKPNETETESTQEVEIALNKPNETNSLKEFEISLYKNSDRYILEKNNDEEIDFSISERIEKIPVNGANIDVKTEYTETGAKDEFIGATDKSGVATIKFKLLEYGNVTVDIRVYKGGFKPMNVKYDFLVRGFQPLSSVTSPTSNSSVTSPTSNSSVTSPTSNSSVTSPTSNSSVTSPTSNSSVTSPTSNSSVTSPTSNSSV